MANRIVTNDSNEDESVFLDYLKFAIPCFICAAIAYGVLYYFGLV